MPGLGRSWEELFQNLLMYKSIYGDCNVPQYFKPDPALGQWVGKQRSRYMDKPEDPKRRRLDEIGFDWSSQEEKNDRIWNEKYERLIFYRSQHGHCRVPKGYKEDPELGNWVSQQRIMWKKKRLSHERFSKLEALNFTWVLVSSKHNQTVPGKLEEKWMEKYRKLAEFKEAYGHCVVPKIYKQDGLGYWTSNQRALHAKGDLPETRKALLDGLGFVWRIPKNAQKPHGMHLDHGSRLSSDLHLTDEENEISPKHQRLPQFSVSD